MKDIINEMTLFDLTGLNGGYATTLLPTVILQIAPLSDFTGIHINHLN